MREPTFWRIQAMVLVVTALHIVLEADFVTRGALHDLSPTLLHMPVVLYLAPVTYAGFVYGFEGGVSTGLLCALLASINIPLWHRHQFEWLAELVLIMIVMGMGIVMSIPVERERRQRRRAEATTRQVRMLNDVVQSSLDRDPEETARSAILRLVDVLEVSGACFGLWKRDGLEPVVTVSHAADPSLAAALEARVAEAGSAHGGDAGSAEGNVLHVALGTEGLGGGLCVGLRPGKELTSAQQNFLQAVGSQLAVGIENALLRQQERDLLESYVRLVTQAQEEERKHIARELHDSAAQQLAALCRGLDEVAESALSEKSRELARLRLLASSTLGELRRFSRDLRPALLDDLGLVPALEWLVADLGDRTAIQAGLSVHGAARRLASEVEVALYRITQEALRNVERHARSTGVFVAVQFEPDRVLVSVQDDGRGFAAPANLGTLVSVGKLGLMGMQERAQLAGGSLTVVSSPGDGTLVTVEVLV